MTEENSLTWRVMGNGFAAAVHSVPLSSILSDGDWHHVRGSYNQNSKLLKLYLNGYEVVRADYTPKKTPHAVPAATSDRGYVSLCGEIYSRTTRNFYGLIDEVHFSVE